MGDQEHIRVLLVDDHAVIRTGLRMIIESRRHLRVVGEATDIVQAHDLAIREQPDIILLDLDLNGESGLDLLPALREQTRSRTILLTGMHNPADHRRGIMLGAVGLITKEQGAEVLLKAIEKVHAGEVWIERTMMAEVLTDMVYTRDDSPRDPEAAKIAALTPREREVITLICQGSANKQIAHHLRMSETTVRHHLTSIFDKLEVASRLELVIYAYHHSLAELHVQRSGT